MESRGAAESCLATVAFVFKFLSLLAVVVGAGPGGGVGAGGTTGADLDGIRPGEGLDEAPDAAAAFIKAGRPPRLIEETVVTLGATEVCRGLEDDEGMDGATSSISKATSVFVSTSKRLTGEERGSLSVADG